MATGLGRMAVSNPRLPYQPFLQDLASQLLERLLGQHRWMLRADKEPLLYGLLVYVTHTATHIGTVINFLNRRGTGSTIITVICMLVIIDYSSKHH